MGHSNILDLVTKRMVLSSFGDDITQVGKLTNNIFIYFDEQ